MLLTWYDIAFVDTTQVKPRQSKRTAQRCYSLGITVVPELVRPINSPSSCCQGDGLQPEDAAITSRRSGINGRGSEELRVCKIRLSQQGLVRSTQGGRACCEVPGPDAVEGSERADFEESKRTATQQEEGRKCLAHKGGVGRLLGGGKVRMRWGDRGSGGEAGS
eukprot:746796-Hanusia_phi.AAC.4